MARRSDRSDTPSDLHRAGAIRPRARGNGTPRTYMLVTEQARIWRGAAELTEVVIVIPRGTPTVVAWM
jgi:hypothetical protein